MHIRLFYRSITSLPDISVLLTTPFLSISRLRLLPGSLKKNGITAKVTVIMIKTAKWYRVQLFRILQLCNLHAKSDGGGSTPLSAFSVISDKSKIYFKKELAQTRTASSIRKGLLTTSVWCRHCLSAKDEGFSQPLVLQTIEIFHATKSEQTQIYLSNLYQGQKVEAAVSLQL